MKPVFLMPKTSLFSRKWTKKEIGFCYPFLDLKKKQKTFYSIAEWDVDTLYVLPCVTVFGTNELVLPTHIHRFKVSWPPGVQVRESQFYTCKSDAATPPPPPPTHVDLDHRTVFR